MCTRTVYGPGVDSASNRNEYQVYFLGGKAGRCVRLTTFHHPVPLSWSLGTITSWNPLGHSSPVTGLLYLSLLQCEQVRSFVGDPVLRSTGCLTEACTLPPLSRIHCIINTSCARSGKVIKHYSFITWFGEEVQLHTFLTLALRYMDRHAMLCFQPRMGPWYLLDRRLGLSHWKIN